MKSTVVETTRKPTPVSHHPSKTPWTVRFVIALLIPLGFGFACAGIFSRSLQHEGWRGQRQLEAGGQGVAGQVGHRELGAGGGRVLDFALPSHVDEDVPSPARPSGRGAHVRGE